MRTLLLLLLLAVAPVAAAERAAPGSTNDAWEPASMASPLRPDPPPGSPCRPHCDLA